MGERIASSESSSSSLLSPKLMFSNTGAECYHLSVVPSFCVSTLMAWGRQMQRADKQQQRKRKLAVDTEVGDDRAVVTLMAVVILPGRPSDQIGMNAACRIPSNCIIVGAGAPTAAYMRPTLRISAEVEVACAKVAIIGLHIRIDNGARTGTDPGSGGQSTGSSSGRASGGLKAFRVHDTVSVLLIEACVCDTATTDGCNLVTTIGGARCTVSDCLVQGPDLYVGQRGILAIKDSHICYVAHSAGISLHGGMADIRSSVIHSCGMSGIYAQENSSVTVSDCSLMLNHRCGVEVFGSLGRIQLMDVNIVHNRQGGVLISGPSGGMVRCQVTANRLANVTVLDSSCVTLEATCSMHSHASGLLVKGAFTVVSLVGDCRITENGLQAIEIYDGATVTREDDCYVSPAPFSHS
jgi:Right handed beta helix region